MEVVEEGEEHQPRQEEEEVVVEAAVEGLHFQEAT